MPLCLICRQEHEHWENGQRSPWCSVCSDRTSRQINTAHDSQPNRPVVAGQEERIEIYAAAVRNEMPLDDPMVRRLIQRVSRKGVEDQCAKPSPS